MLKIKTVLAFKFSENVFIMLINVKMPAMVWHFIILSMINFMRLFSNLVFVVLFCFSHQLFLQRWSNFSSSCVRTNIPKGNI